MTFLRLARGKKGEDEAAKALKQKGYRILLRNYRCSMGEIDIIAEKDGALVFTEVRTKTSTVFGLPQESVTLKKQEKIKRVVQMYLLQTKQHHRPVSFCVAAVQLSRDGRLINLEIIENAF